MIDYEFCPTCREMVGKVPHDTRKGEWVWVCGACNTKLVYKVNPFLSEVDI